MKNRWIMMGGYFLLLATLVGAFYGIGQTLASGRSGFAQDDDEYRGRGAFDSPDPVYLEECGSCHMAYPPGLLPPDGWRAIMGGLSDHFGDDAGLDSATRSRLEDYLQRASVTGAYHKLRRNRVDPAPQRITRLPYFVREHDEIPSRFVRGNDKVNSLSQCNACHREAERGLFDEDDIVIPGFGRWDD